MARGKKTGGRDFKKGQSGNPRGPKPAPLEERMKMRLTQALFILTANKYLFSTKAEIKEILENPNTIALDLAVVSWIHAGIKGDGRLLELLISRLIGKMTLSIEHSGPSGGPIPVQDLSHLSDEELAQEVRKIRARLNMAVGDES